MLTVALQNGWGRWQLVMARNESSPCSVLHGQLAIHIGGANRSRRSWMARSWAGVSSRAFRGPDTADADLRLFQTSDLLEAHSSEPARHLLLGVA
jgi:hypothetical protein